MQMSDTIAMGIRLKKKRKVYPYQTDKVRHPVAIKSVPGSLFMLAVAI